MSEMDVYITRYVLTAGISRAKAEASGVSVDTIIVRYKGRMGFDMYHRGDWCQSWEGALKRAEEMRRKKLASLEKSIEKVKAIEFREPKHD